MHAVQNWTACYSSVCPLKGSPIQEPMMNIKAMTLNGFGDALGVSKPLIFPGDRGQSCWSFLLSVKDINNKGLDQTSRRSDVFFINILYLV